MNSEYAVGNIRIRFESRARRRWFVALWFAALAVLDLATCLLNPKINPGASRIAPPAAIAAHGAWIICGFAILYVALFIVLTWIAGGRSDERETHRRQQAFSRAYPVLGFGIVAAFLSACFSGPNPISPISSLALREFLVPLPFIVLTGTLYLYLTLPRAILLWTEPDMEGVR